MTKKLTDYLNGSFSQNPHVHYEVVTETDTVQVAIPEPTSSEFEFGWESTDDKSLRSLGDLVRASGGRFLD